MSDHTMPKPATTSLILRPGDRVLVASSARLTPEGVRQIKARLSERFPDVEFTVMDTVAAMALMHPSGEAARHA